MLHPLHSELCTPRAPSNLGEIPPLLPLVRVCLEPWLRVWPESECGRLWFCRSARVVPAQSGPMPSAAGGGRLCLSSFMSVAPDADEAESNRRSPSSYCCPSAYGPVTTSILFHYIEVIGPQGIKIHFLSHFQSYKFRMENKE